MPNQTPSWTALISHTAALWAVMDALSALTPLLLRPNQADLTDSSGEHSLYFMYITYCTGLSHTNLPAHAKLPKNHQTAYASLSPAPLDLITIQKSL